MFYKYICRLNEKSILFYTCHKRFEEDYCMIQKPSYLMKQFIWQALVYRIIRSGSETLSITQKANERRYFMNHGSIHLQSVRYLCKFGYCRFLVNKFLFIQISKLGSIKTNTKIGAKHPLTVLGLGK